MTLPIITELKTKEQFKKCLIDNPGVVIIKFGASWCNPCKVIEDDVKTYFSEMPDNIQCMNIDVDESIEVYGFLKTKKMINGIPALLAYYAGNHNYIPDEFVNGTDKNELKIFFDTCLEEAGN